MVEVKSSQPGHNFLFWFGCAVVQTVQFLWKTLNHMSDVANYCVALCVVT